MTIIIKTCGLSTPESVNTAIRNGVDMIGFNFFDRSPRYVPYDTARALASQVTGETTRVGLIVDFSDQEIAALMSEVPLDMLQLHGRETPDRVSRIRKMCGRPVMKALPVATSSDLACASAYRDVVDYFLFDAKPPKGSDRPGGNAVSFDWTLMRAYEPGVPWLLAGGLNLDNVVTAIKASGAPGVDLASGIESRPGVKDDGLIRSFIQAVRRVQ